MSQTHSIKSYLPYSFLAAVVYTIFLIIFIKDYSYSQIYLLFVGNLLFGICIAFFLWHLHNQFSHTTTMTGLIQAGMITTAFGIIFSAVITVLILLLLAPELFSLSTPNEKITHAPVALQNSYSIITILLFSVLVTNLIAGGFISVLFSATIKRVTNR